MPFKVIWRFERWSWANGNGFENEEATQKVRGLLSEVPQCVSFGEDICAFLNPNLMVSTYPDTDRAGFMAYGGEYNDKIHIMVGLDSDRVAEALMHELLHAGLLRDGFPDCQFEGHEYDERGVLNYVQHEIMFPQYQEFSLDCGKFLGPIDIQGQAEISEYLDDEACDFAFWCRQWCFDYQYFNLVGDEIYIKWIDTEWRCVVEKFPRISDTVEMIKAWLERGDYRKPQAFAAAYNELLALMGMSSVPYDRWFRLEAGSHGLIPVKTNNMK